MAAYSAVVSFGQLLKQLLDSDQFPLDSQNSLIESLYRNVSSLQSSLEQIFPAPKNKRSTANNLGIQIRDAIYKAQDTIESFIFSQSLSSESQEIPGDASISLQEIIADIDPMIKEAEKLADSVAKNKEDRLAGDVSQPFKSSSSSKSNKIVGQDEDKKLLTAELLRDEDRLQVVPISGMAGIGKTTLATSIYDDDNIKSQFAFRAWVTVSQDYHAGEIMAKLLNSMESRGQKAGDTVFQDSDEDLSVHLHQSLYNRRYLVVVDDMWDKKVWEDVRNSLPDNGNRSRILLTTRILNVAKSVGSEFCHLMKPLGGEDSWMLLCEKIFGGPHCPPYLEKIGRQIAENCRGLPLSLTVIGGLLSQGSKTEKYWQSIVEDTFAAADAKFEDSYLEILSLSYNHLPAKLKACFLYMGAFPEDSEILVSKLIRLWVAEGILTLPSPSQLVEKVAEQSLEDLIDRNLVLVRTNRSDGRIKTCGMHDSLRELAEKESGKEKFWHSRKHYAQKPEEGTNTQRRISVHKTTLMCREEVYDSTKSITHARTLLYVGPHHHHPLPFLLTFDLLRVLDAFTVYFFDFPYEFVKLIHLRYLSFTYNGKLPSSLSKLQKLQILIVRREPKIIFVGASFLPDEIWSMQQLRHIIFTETDFPFLSDAKTTEQNSGLLENLQCLSNVNAVSCTRQVLQNMRNLRKLGMWVEAPGAVDLSLDELKHLEAFKFIVLKPVPKSKIEFKPQLFFPETLKKLTLSGCGLSWKDMKVIRSQLPHLEVLKLQELAFQGEEWRLEEDEDFPQLKFLLIEYLDFKSWIANDSHFPSLERLILRHCYELEGIPSDIGVIGCLKLIELVDCSRPAMKSAEHIKEEQESFDNKCLQVRIYSSWE